MPKSRLIIRLGPQWAQFTYAREGLELLGTVQCGAQIGALARLSDGSFAQVNGDWTVPLSASRVQTALRQAEARPPKRRSAQWDETALQHPSPAAAPVVIVRKRRRIPEAVDV